MEGLFNKVLRASETFTANQMFVHFSMKLLITPFQ